MQGVFRVRDREQKPGFLEKPGFFDRVRCSWRDDQARSAATYASITARSPSAPGFELPWCMPTMPV